MKINKIRIRDYIPNFGYTLKKMFLKGCRLSLLVGLMLTFFCTTAYAGPPTTTKFTTGLASDVGYFLQVNNGGWKDLKTPKHWGTESSTTAMCLDHTKNGPTSTQNYVRFSPSSVYSQRTINGLYAIIENGYPYNSHGMSGNEIKTATTNAIRIWMRESEGIGYSYMTTGNIQAKSGYSHVYNVMVDLVNCARNADSNYLSWSGKRITTSPSVVQLAPNSSGTALTATFTVSNPASTTKVDTSKLPNGVSITGSGSTWTITAPIGTGDMNLSNVFYGKDNKSVSSIYFYKPSYGSSYQPLIVWDYVTEHTVVYGDLSVKGMSGGYLRVVKFGETTATRLQGAKFDVYDSSDHRVATLTTASNGQAKTGLLPSGRYYIVETQAPTGYVRDTTKHYGNVGSTMNTHTINLMNTKIRGRVKLIKTDDDGNRLGGAVFGLYGTNNTLITELTTNSNGEATSPLLNYGYYYLKEITAPNKHLLNTSKYMFNISTNNKTVTVNATNIPFKGRVQITKVGEQSDVLQGAKFGVYNTSNVLVEEIRTNSNGVATSPLLHYGDYYIKETQAPTGYVLNTDRFNFTITNNNQTIPIEVSNTIIRGYAKIVKRDSLNSSLLSGAVFGIYDSNNQLLETITTDSNGEATSPLLKYGDYYFKEITAPAKYVLGDSTHNFSIRQNNQTLTVNITNDPIRGRVRINKVNENNEPMEGVVFGVYDSNNQLLEELSTDVDGIAVSSLLRYGDYYVKEISTLESYALDITQHPFEIRNHLSVIDLNLTNHLIRGKVQITKTDETDTPLEGVVFEIYDTDDTLIETLTTDTDGITTSNDLIYGDYYLKEKSTLAPYNMLTDTIPFEIRVNKATIPIEVKNTFKRGNFKIIKVGESGEPLQGVVFELYDINDALLQTLKTDENGEAVSAELIYSNYYLKEISTLKQFNLIEDRIPIEIRENGATVPVTIENKLIRGNVKIIKTNVQNSNPIQGVVFTLMNENKETIEELTTDEKGELLSKTLFYGTYYIQEKSVPSGYILDNKLHEFEITEDGTVELNIQNQPIVGTVEVYFRHVDHKHELHKAYSFTDWVDEPYMDWVNTKKLDKKPLDGYSFVKADYPTEQKLVDGKLMITYWYDEKIKGGGSSPITSGDIIIPKTGEKYSYTQYAFGIILTLLSTLVLVSYLLKKKEKEAMIKI